MNVTATASSLNNAAGARSTRLPVAILGAIALAPALLSMSRVNILETTTAGGLLFLAVLFFVVKRYLSPAATGISLAVLFVATLLNLSPLSLRSTLQQGWNGSSAERWLALGVPAGCAVLMALMSLQSNETENRIARTAGSLSVRFNLWLISCLMLAGGLLMGGYSVQNGASLAVLLAASAIALRSVLLIANDATAPKILAGAIAVALAANLVGGVRGSMELNAAFDRGHAAVVAKNDAEAQNALYDAVRLNERMQSRSRNIDIQREWGLLDEEFGRFEPSLVHWRVVAELTGVEQLAHPAIRRILVRQGDSLMAWRQLVQQGFSSVMNDELVPGFMALGDRPDADVRGTLLTALVRWEHGDSEAERRASLEKVLTKRANDVSANALLNVLGRPMPKDALWLGDDLIVGARASESSYSGAIQDLGSTDSLVFLTEGRWECRVKARGTPLNEEWPILRVELDGVEALRARVDKISTMELPFTFDVKTRNLFRIRFVFENQLTLFQGNQRAQRGLAVEGVYFLRAGP